MNQFEQEQPDQGHPVRGWRQTANRQLRTVVVEPLADTPSDRAFHCLSCKQMHGITVAQLKPGEAPHVKSAQKWRRVLFRCPNDPESEPYALLVPLGQ